MKRRLKRRERLKSVPHLSLKKFLKYAQAFLWKTLIKVSKHTKVSWWEEWVRSFSNFRLIFLLFSKTQYSSDTSKILDL